MRKPGWYHVKDENGFWQCAQWNGCGWHGIYAVEAKDGAWLEIGPRIPTPDDVSWHESTARQIREMCDGLTGNQIRWTLDGALTASPTAPAGKGGGAVPDMTSAIVNDCCWTFVEAMPHNLPGPIFNDLKPALYEALKQYHGSMLEAAPKPETQP